MTDGNSQNSRQGELKPRLQVVTFVGQHAPTFVGCWWPKKSYRVDGRPNWWTMFDHIAIFQQYWNMFDDDDQSESRKWITWVMANQEAGTESRDWALAGYVMWPHSEWRESCTKLYNVWTRGLSVLTPTTFMNIIRQKLGPRWPTKDASFVDVALRFFLRFLRILTIYGADFKSIIRMDVSDCVEDFLRVRLLTVIGVIRLSTI